MTRYTKILLTINVISLTIFTKTAVDVLSNNTIIDTALTQSISHLQTPLLTTIFTDITTIAAPAILTTFAILLFVWTLYKRRFKESLLVSSAMMSGLLSHSLIKLLIHRPRPELALFTEPTFSFPSGHATMSTIFFSILIILISRHVINRWIRLAGITICTLLILLISFSRIYLNVHYMSDVLAGLTLGLFWITLLLPISRFLKPQSSQQKTQLTDDTYHFKR